MNQTKSYIFVIVQFGLIGALLITGPVFPQNSIFLLVELSGIALGIWAVFSMQIGNFNITPIPKKKGKLTTTGPYKIIRHPMYAAILLTLLPLIISDSSAMRFIFYGVLTVDLVAKSYYEENLLSKSLIGYTAYRKNTYRIIPYLY